MKKLKVPPWLFENGKWKQWISIHMNLHHKALEEVRIHREMTNKKKVGSIVFGAK